MKRQIIKGDRNDIGLIACYKRGKYGLYTAHLRTGKLVYDSEAETTEKQIITRKTGELDLARAELKGKQFVEELKLAWDKEFGAAAGSSDTPSGRAIADEVNALLEKIKIEKGVGNTYRGYYSEGMALLRLLGDYQTLPSCEHTGPEFSRIASERCDELDENTDSRRQCLWKMRHLASRIPGLPKECVEALRAPVRPRGQPTESHAFSDSDIIIMGKHLSKATNTQRALFWGGATRSQHRVDMAFLKWSDYDQWRNSQGSSRRMKTKIAFSHYVWPELFDAIRVEDRKKGDYYMFPDLVYSKRQLKDPLCNKTRLPAAELRRRAVNVSVRMGEVFDEFLVACGIKREGISFKSFRCYNASLGMASGQSHRVLMTALGIVDLKTLLRYAGSTEEQVIALGEFFRQHWLAVMKGRKPTFIGCLTQAVQVLSERYEASIRSARKELNLTRRELEVMRKELKELRTLLLAILAKTAAKHDGVENPLREAA